ncbi:hypothetical protein Nepgr_018218 [Nepenthes gracilis]|uniref:HMA domain-containing protein n=1 Tax=Nepenthes gracilis TaxID=150966 RepID=A0AAD3XSW1_NEPGR|nr:hypothetical protein Nepgr_018218 [Nepenthes gracilis]
METATLSWGYSAFLVALFVSTSCYSHGAVKTVEVIGSVECVDCLQRNVKEIHAFNGEMVTMNIMSSPLSFKYH